MLEFPIKRTITIDDSKKGRKKKSAQKEKVIIKGSVNLPVREPLKKLDPLPKKAKTIEKFLGKDFKVLASRGHLRDLPRNQFGVDVSRDFAPTYIDMYDKKKIIEELRHEYVRSKKVYLATDPDREGEAISWHLAHILEMDLQ